MAKVKVQSGDWDRDDFDFDGDVEYGSPRHEALADALGVAWDDEEYHLGVAQDGRWCLSGLTHCDWAEEVP